MRIDHINDGRDLKTLKPHCVDMWTCHDEPSNNYRINKNTTKNWKTDHSMVANIKLYQLGKLYCSLFLFRSFKPEVTVQMRHPE